MMLLAAKQVFTGTELLDGATIRINNGVIASVARGVAADATYLDGLLAPGLIDVQVNGGGGVLFNDAPTLESLRTIANAHAKLGTTGFMATLISDERSKTAAAIEAVAQGIREGLPGLLGLHLEGPWLSEPRRGVHPQRFLRALDASDMELLTRRNAFPLLITLAPEQATAADVRTLANAGVVVSIGHTAAPHDDIEAMIAAGATGFTHLYNAMPPLEGRNPGALGVALASREAWTGLILDGIHVHPVSARAAFAAKTDRKLMLVSDAMSTVGAATASMTLFGEPISVSEGALRTTSGTLAGAHLSLAEAVRNATSLIGATREQALRMATLTPAQFLRIDRRHGYIAPGARADFVVLNDDLTIRQVWIGGNDVG